MQTPKPIIISRKFKASKEKLWAAFTDPVEMKKWYFEMMDDFKAEVGFETEFLIVNDGKKFTHLWKVSEVTPYQSITVDWKIAEYPGDSFVRYTFEEQGDHTLLTLHSEVTNNYPDNIPEFKRESGVDGWNFFINQRLPAYLAE